MHRAATRGDQPQEQLLSPEQPVEAWVGRALEVRVPIRIARMILTRVYRNTMRTLDRIERSVAPARELGPVDEKTLTRDARWFYETTIRGRAGRMTSAFHVRRCPECHASRTFAGPVCRRIGATLCGWCREEKW